MSSKEDAWPLWLANRARGSGSFTVEAERYGAPLKSWQDQGIRVGCVCANCNNGWMSRLEGRAKSIVDALLDDHPPALSSAERTTIATWAVKTSMVFEFTTPRLEPMFTEGDRMPMRVSQSIPLDTRVWMGVCVEQNHLHCTSHRLGTPHGASELRGLATTLVFGPIAIQVLLIKRPPEMSPSIRLTFEESNGPWDQTLIDLWPTGPDSAAWPPPMGLLGEGGVEILAERFSPPSGAA